MPTDKVIVHLYAPGNRIAGSVTIPSTMVYDFDALLAHARVQYPAYSLDDLIRRIWLKGLVATRISIRRGTLPAPGRQPRQEWLLPPP